MRLKILLIKLNWEKPLLFKPLEDIRHLVLSIKYPQTNGLVLSSVTGHQICRCFGVSRQEVEKFLNENPELSLKLLTPV